MEDMSLTTMLEVSITLGVALAFPPAPSWNGVVMREEVCEVVERLHNAVGLSAMLWLMFSMEIELRLSIRLSVDIEFRFGSGPKWSCPWL